MVRGLQKICENFIPNSSKPINILESIAEYKIENGEEPTIIICFESWLSLSQILLKDSLFGNRYNVLCQKLEQFLTKLTEAGCKVVSLFHTSVSKEESLREERQQDYVSKTKLYDLMEEEQDLELLTAKILKVTNRSDYFKSHNPDNYMMLAGIAKKHGEVIRVYSNEIFFHKLHYLQYFNQKNVLAVVAFDSDFLLYEGTWKYWSSKHLKIEDMTTIEFDKKEVLDYLGLRFDQVPMFHSLVRDAGVFNTHHHYTIAKSLKKYADFKNHWYENVGPFITDHPYQTFSQLQRIKRVLFKREPPSSHFIGNIQKCLRFYTYNDEVDNEQNNIVLEQYKGVNSELVLELVHQWPTYIRYVMADLRDACYVKMTDLIVALLRRVGGVILKAADQSSTIRPWTITINLKRSHEQFFKAEEFPVLAPEFEVPRIDQIVYGYNKYQMLLFITELDLDEDHLKAIEIGKMLKIITLTLLIKAELLDQREAVGILKTLLEQKQFVEEPENVIYPERVNVRLHRVCCLLFEVYSLFQRCLEATGFDPSQFNMYMDGVHFHNLMMNNFPATEGTTEKWDGDTTIFNQLLKYA